MDKEKPDYYIPEEIDQAIFNFLRHGDKPPKPMGQVRQNIFELSDAKIIPREEKKSKHPILVFVARTLRLARS